MSLSLVGSYTIWYTRPNTKLAATIKSGRNSLSVTFFLPQSVSVSYRFTIRCLRYQILLPMDNTTMVRGLWVKMLLTFSLNHLKNIYVKFYIKKLKSDIANKQTSLHVRHLVKTSGKHINNLFGNRFQLFYIVKK